MRIDLRLPHIFVPEKFLDRPNIIVVFQKMSCKTMPKRMAARVLVDIEFLDRPFHGALDCTWRSVVPSLNSVATRGSNHGRRK